MFAVFRQLEEVSCGSSQVGQYADSCSPHAVEQSMYSSKSSFSTTLTGTVP